MDNFANKAIYSSTSVFEFDSQSRGYIKAYSPENSTTATQPNSLQYNPSARSSELYILNRGPLFVSQQYYPPPNTDYPVFPVNHQATTRSVDWTNSDPSVSPSTLSGASNSILSISPYALSEPLYPDWWSSNPVPPTNGQSVELSPEGPSKRPGDGPVLICPTCKKPHTRKNRMEDCHSRDNHQKRHPCNGLCGKKTCKMAYVSADGLRRHLWPEKHRRTPCPYCGKSGSRQNIARHKSTCPQRRNQDY